MKRREQIEKEATNYINSDAVSPMNMQLAFGDFINGAQWADRTMIEKACKCYCDDICDKGRCGMCFHKHDGKGQVKNTFRYNECNELKLIRKAMEE